MGIIILPFLIGAIIIVIKSVLTILPLFKADTFSYNNFIYGTLISLFIFGIIVLSYLLKEKSWALSPVFRFPLFMIYLPFIAIHFCRNIFGKHLSLLNNSLTISIIVSALFLIIFNGYVFNIIEKLGREKYY